MYARDLPTMGRIGLIDLLLHTSWGCIPVLGESIMGSRAICVASAIIYVRNLRTGCRCCVAYLTALEGARCFAPGLVTPGAMRSVGFVHDD